MSLSIYSMAPSLRSKEFEPMTKPVPPGLRGSRRSCGPPVSFLNTRWGRDEVAGRHSGSSLRRKQGQSPLRPSEVDMSSRLQDSMKQTRRQRERVSMIPDEELAYVVELRRPPPVIHVDVHAGRKHARRTPSPPRRVKRKQAFTDGRSLAREGQHGYVSSSPETPLPGLSSGSSPLTDGHQDFISTPISSPRPRLEACLASPPAEAAAPVPQSPPSKRRVPILLRCKTFLAIIRPRVQPRTTTPSIATLDLRTSTDRPKS